MTRYAALAAVLVLMGGCEGEALQASEARQERYKLEGDTEIIVWRDDERGVTCFVYGRFRGGGIDCIPNSQLNPQRDEKDAKP